MNWRRIERRKEKKRSEEKRTRFSRKLEIFYAALLHLCVFDGSVGAGERRGLLRLR